MDSRFVCAMPARRNIQSRGNPLAAWLFLVGHNTWFGFAHGLTANWMYDAQLAFLAFVLLTIRPLVAASANSGLNFVRAQPRLAASRSAARYPQYAASSNSDKPERSE